MICLKFQSRSMDTEMKSRFQKIASVVFPAITNNTVFTLSNKRLDGLEFNGPVNIITVISSQSLNWQKNVHNTV